MHFRGNPYSPIENTEGKSVGQLIIELGEKLKDGSVTSKPWSSSRFTRFASPMNAPECFPAIGGSQRRTTTKPSSLA